MAVKQIKLELALIFDGFKVTTSVEGMNVADLTRNLPETLNTMLQHLGTARQVRDTGDVMSAEDRRKLDEFKAMQKAKMVRPDAGSTDAGADAGQTWDLLPPPGVPTPEGG